MQTGTILWREGNIKKNIFAAFSPAECVTPADLCNMCVCLYTVFVYWRKCTYSIWVFVCGWVCREWESVFVFLCVWSNNSVGGHHGEKNHLFSLCELSWTARSGGLDKLTCVWYFCSHQYMYFFSWHVLYYTVPTHYNICLVSCIQSFTHYFLTICLSMSI